MKAQTETTCEPHTTLVEAVGAIEGQKARDQTTVLLKGAWNMAKPYVELGAEAGLDWVEQQGGFVKVRKKAAELATNGGEAGYAGQGEGGLEGDRRGAAGGCAEGGGGFD